LLPTLDSELAEIVEECLEKDRERRLHTAREMSRRLGDIARRLATDPGELDRTPRRRATDRLPEPAQRQSLADTGLPLGVRFWHGLGLPIPSRGVVAMLGLFLGVGIGVGVGKQLGGPAPVVIHTTSNALAEPVAKAELPRESAVSPQNLPALHPPTDTNLAHAMSKELAQKTK
jgi:hypothetical protein